jgi:16S rRNA processing protein RimM
VDASGSELRAGRVGRAHGLDGSFYVTRAVPRLLTLGASVLIDGRSAAIVRRAGTDARPIVRLDGVEDRPAAEALRGAELLVRAQAAPALGAGEWWAHELEGCVVTDADRRIGTVSRLIELPSCEALEVVREHGADRVLVPMVKDAIRSIDAAARRIDVDAAFLDLSEAPVRRGGAADGA